MTDSTEIWTQTILPANSSIKQAIQVLNESSLRIILVTDTNQTLVGTISDGDIRRGLLKGLELTSSIESIIHHDSLTVPPGVSRDAVVKLMTANHVQQVPIVDENLRVVGLHLWDQINALPARRNTMVIMAGGKGTRLLPHTENCPKPLLPVAGKPILEHIILRAKSEGFSHFVIAIYYLGHMIEEYFGDGSALEVKIEYLREESPLGTAGALCLLEPVPELPLVVTNGDVLTDIHYGAILDFHIQNRATATMAVHVHEWQNPFGVVQTHGIEITGYEEKPISRAHINAGVYIINPSTINLLKKSVSCDMPTLFSSIQLEGHRAIAYPIHERWLDVGRPNDLVIASLQNLKDGENS